MFIDSYKFLALSRTVNKIALTSDVRGRLAIYKKISLLHIRRLLTKRSTRDDKFRLKGGVKKHRIFVLQIFEYL